MTNRNVEQLGKIYALLMTSRFLGTLLAQVFLIPSAILLDGWSNGFSNMFEFLSFIRACLV